MATDTRRSSKTIELTDTASGLSYYNNNEENDNMNDIVSEHDIIQLNKNNDTNRRRYSIPSISVVNSKNYNTKLFNRKNNKNDYYNLLLQNKINTVNTTNNNAVNWEPVIDHAVKAIVSIKANHVRSFDTEFSGAYNATGFIVDKNRGIILTNRHVVSPAPIRATAVFLNYEEIELIPIYRDPVHDFGFFKFNTKDVKFMQLVEIPLMPSKAKVGIDIRVVGNDAGEKLSILSGTLARLDRQAPNYGIGEYNDFNTFYYQAASGTSGGSSGSPVLDIEGNSIALNAGGSNKASSSYYLPLNRVTRALKFIQNDQGVPRGTLLTVFMHIPYDEARRLGLPQDIESCVRKFNSTGLLVVSNVLPDTPFSNKLYPGDIILKTNNKYTLGFDRLFEIIDNNVHQNITLEIFRSSKRLTIEVQVLDLHKYTPNRFVEIGGGTCHDLSYQMARGYNHPVKGVYVAASGYMFSSASCWRNSVVLSINHKPTPNLNKLIEVLQELRDKQRVPIKFYCLTKPHRPKVMIMDIDKHWHPFRLATRNDSTGLWDYIPILEKTKVINEQRTLSKSKSIENKKTGIDRVEYSFVTIDFHIPYLIDGMKNTQYFGSGVIVDKHKGLIVCDRDTIPIAIGDVKITFHSTTIIEGKIEFMHPVFNFVIIRYDPNLVENNLISVVQSSKKELETGEEVYFVGISSDHSTIKKKTKINSVNNNIGTKECTPPRWRAMNVENIKIEDSVISQGGVLCYENGDVCALWANYTYQDDKGNEASIMSGLSWRYIDQILEKIRNSSPVHVRSLNAEFWKIRMSAAKSLGLDEEWADKYTKIGKQSLFYVLNVLPNKLNSNHIKHNTKDRKDTLCIGDIILEVEDSLVTKMSDLNLFDSEKVKLRILRDGQIFELLVETTILPNLETTRIVCWMGAVVQTPNFSVLEQAVDIPTSNVYISCTLYGSPVNSFDVRPGVWITEVEEKNISDMDDFIQTVRKLDKEYVKLKTISRTGQIRALSLKTDNHYWPMWIIDNNNKT